MKGLNLNGWFMLLIFNLYINVGLFHIETEFVQDNYTLAGRILFVGVILFLTLVYKWGLCDATE